MNTHKKVKGIQGFTLVELSIVIIIIGLLIAGVATGTSLLKQAELNSVINDLQDYNTAYNNFVNRYAAAPGDFNAAGTLWPQCTATNTDCNGNGNGLIDLGGAGAVTNEGVLAWRHLFLADMIPSGIQDPILTTTPLKIGASNPASKVGGAGYMMFVGGDNSAGGFFVWAGITTLTTTTGLWNDSKTNAVFIGKPGAALFLDNGALTAEQAFNIDKKLDDGAANNGIFSGASTGYIRTFEGIGAMNSCLTPSGNPFTASDYYAVGSTGGTPCVVALGFH